MENRSVAPSKGAGSVSAMIDAEIAENILKALIREAVALNMARARG